MKNTIEEIEKSLLTKYIIDDTPCPRTYIFPDGKFLHLDCFNDHASVKYLLVTEFGYTKEEAELENYGVIRVNLDTEGFVALSKIKPTNIQYESLLNELDMCWHRCAWRYGKFMIIEPERDKDGYYLKNGFHYYSLGKDKYTSDEFIKIIKRYYATRKLVEQVESK